MTDWQQDNGRCLDAALRGVRALLEQQCRSLSVRPLPDTPNRAEPDASAPPSVMSPPSALETACTAFGLSDFERNVLLLCAGVELDPEIGDLCAVLNGNASCTWATFALSLRLFPHASHQATTPWAPLRRWKLVDVGPGPALMRSPLRIDERILHYLAGVSQLDERLDALCEAVAAPRELPFAHADLVRQAAATWSDVTGREVWPVIQWYGSDRETRRSLAASTCAQLGLNVRALSVHAVPTAPEDLATLQRLWEREAILSRRALLLETEDGEPISAERARGISWLIDRTRGGVHLSGARLWPAIERPVVAFDVSTPATDEPDGLGSHRRTQARLKLDDLAQRIEAVAGWDDLIIPPPQRATLQDMAMHVRRQRTVYHTWGFASKGTRGLGVSGLFAGPSGTGKTMAAEVLARELDRDLYRIDLSAVVSKYIGETEKNLRRIFDAAEGGGVVLLFDEADALFGKRSEVKDSHDRHANIEVSYLLQRMEAYRGLAILTTNMKESLDTAFLRRIRFVVQFPFPDADHRAAIWRRVFPHATPVEGLDAARLAQMHLTGGNIRNIALNGAFAAADEGGPVRMSHLLQAARGEYAKLEKPLTDSEMRGWVR